MLPSNPLKEVRDDEDLTRFLTQSNHSSSMGVKPAAFLPSAKNRTTSVFRLSDDRIRMQETFAKYLHPHLTMKGAAVIAAHRVRAAGLHVRASEPPPRHADLENWPWIQEDPALEKARQKEIAVKLAGESRLVRF